MLADMSSKFPHVDFCVISEYLDDDGLWNPRDDDPPLTGGVQINLSGTREQYLQLAATIRDFAEQNTLGDPDYHKHFDDLFSVNRKFRVHLIMRKHDLGVANEINARQRDLPT
jgi:hypothetical protein